PRWESINDFVDGWIEAQPLGSLQKYCGHQETVVFAVARAFNAGEICFSWAQSKGRVRDGGLDLEQEHRKVIVKATKGPGRLSDWYVALRYLADVARDLSVATQVVNKLLEIERCVDRAESKTRAAHCP